MTFALFHDFPGLKNGPPKFQDFRGPVGILHSRIFRNCQQYPLSSSQRIFIS